MRNEVKECTNPFDKGKLIALLNSGEKDLPGANLRGADLLGANLDFSCLPLWCGGLGWKIDKRIACQIAYHFCSMLCDDAEFIAARNAILPLANKFHKVAECGILVPIMPKTFEEKEENL